MKILGIETSCDETSVSVVEDGYKLHSLVVNSQIDIHKAFGGVVPEIAARSHIEVMLPVVQQALDEAECTWDDIDAIAVTQGPGLLGSLLIGVLTARTLAWTLGKPLYPVHHILGHAYVNWLTDKIDNAKLDSYTLPNEKPEFPVLTLIVSGGHSQLMYFTDHLKGEILGKTRDDAVGEAFDKVAKIIGLPYPGGPSIEKVTPHGDKLRYKLPISKLDNPYDFSFSGLKTAVLRTAQQVAGVGYDFPSFKLAEKLTEQQKLDIAASFQETAITTLARVTKKAAEQFQPKTIILGGGVAASQALRHKLTEVLDQPLHITDRKLCTDNAAMIAALGYYESLYRQSADPLSVTTEPSLKIPFLQ